MSSVIAAQVNTGYVEVTYRNLRKRTFLRALIQSAVETFGRGENGFSWGFDTFERKYSASRSTVWRTTKDLKEDESFEVGRIGKASGELRYKGELEHNTYIRVENWFNTQEFHFVRRDKNGVPIESYNRKLKPSEVAVFSLIYTYWKGNKKFNGTYKTIAESLGLSVETVCRDMHELFAAKLIVRPHKRQKQKEGWESTFTVHRKTFKKYADPIKEQEKEKAKPPKTDKASKEKAYIEAVNMRAVRESYYAHLERERVNKAERYKKSVYMQVPQFEELSLKVRKAELEAVKAVGEDATLLEIKAETLRKQRLTMANAYNIVLERFEPEYYGKNQCKECKGTGYLHNGSSCDCWQSKGGT